MMPGCSSQTAIATALLLGLFVLPARAAQQDEPAEEPARPAANDSYSPARERMVDRHLADRGLEDERVLNAFRIVPRHRFVPEAYQRLAYEDESIPIGEGQTITAPYDVAFMTDVLKPEPTDKVYEVGTGSGYQASILGQLVAEVYSVEIHEPLVTRAIEVMKDLGYDNIHAKHGDGYLGWPEAAPFDKIIVTCAPEAIPRPLVDQLKEGGRLVIPIGSRFDQKVYVFDKKDGELVGDAVRPTLFVPMTGRAQREAAERRARGETTEPNDP